MLLFYIDNKIRNYEVINYITYDLNTEIKYLILFIFFEIYDL